MLKTLVIVDPQNDFVIGSLAVPKAKEIFPFINSIADNYECIIVTNDWHPANHKAFVNNNPNNNLYDIINLNGVQQVLWPVHCVEKTFGAENYKELDVKIDRFILKGMNPEYHPYGAFIDGDGTYTPLNEYLKNKYIKTFDVVGLATDYCVKTTVLDGLKLGFNINVLTKGMRAVNINPDDGDKAIKEMKEAGANIIN